jgi:hypothetical protein
LLIKGSGSVPGNAYGPTINDSGAIAYFTGSPNYSIQYAADGHNPKAVISRGDSLFGSTAGTFGIGATAATGRYLNASGQIAFLYTLSNGRHGIALASPAQ